MWATYGNSPHFDAAPEFPCIPLHASFNSLEKLLPGSLGLVGIPLIYQCPLARRGATAKPDKTEVIENNPLFPCGSNGSGVII